MTALALTSTGRLKLSEDHVTEIKLRGNVPSKKNGYRRSANGRMYIPDGNVAAIDSLILQAQSQWRRRPAIENPDLEFTFAVNDLRSDRDNKLTTCMDVLQRAGVLVNDNTRRCNGRIVIHPAVVDEDEGVLIRISEANRER